MNTINNNESVNELNDDLEFGNKVTETLGSEDGAKAFGDVKKVLETGLIVDEYINVYEKHGIEAATILYI